MNPVLRPTSLFDTVKYVGFLGQGAYGSVKGYTLPDGSSVAIKTIELELGELSDSSIVELHSLSVLKGKSHIMQLLEVQTDIESIQIMSVQYTGSLLQFISTVKLEDRISVFDSVCEQLLLGLHHIYRASIIHRDIKPDNIFVNFDLDLDTNKLTQHPQCYYADFGLALQLNCAEGNQAMSNNVYTPGYKAPEVLKGEEYCYKADVWALGITLLQYLAPEFDIHHEDLEVELQNLQALSQISYGEEELDIDGILTFLMPEHLVKEIAEKQVETIQAMLIFNPDIRNHITDFIQPDDVYPRTVYLPKRGAPLSKLVTISLYYSVVTWMIDFLSVKTFYPNVVIGTMDLFERYVANYKVADRVEFHATMVCCMLLAVKVGDDVSMNASDFPKYYNLEAVNALTPLVLKRLNYISATCETSEFINTLTATLDPERILRRLYRYYHSKRVYSGAVTYMKLSLIVSKLESDSA